MECHTHFGNENLQQYSVHVRRRKNSRKEGTLEAIDERAINSALPWELAALTVSSFGMMASL